MIVISQKIISYKNGFWIEFKSKKRILQMVYCDNKTIVLYADKTYEFFKKNIDIDKIAYLITK